MKKYALPQRLADMEHVLASELADHLDDYLDRCSTENIGFIVDTDKKSYVLCPARWFDYACDDDFGVIVNAALRYAIGRHTYLPPTIVAFIRKYLTILDDRTLHVICTDIERELLSDEGVDDPGMWKNLLEDCRAVLEQRQQKQ